MNNMKEMAAHQAPPSLGFSRQEHWSGLPFPSMPFAEALASYGTDKPDTRFGMKVLFFTFPRTLPPNGPVVSFEPL